MRRYGIFLIVFFVLFIGCKDKEKSNVSQKIRQIPVSYIEIKGEKVVLLKELPGRVSSYQTAKIIPQVSGIILKRVFKEGSYVKKDDLLYIIDPAIYKARLDQAEASLRIAEAKLPSLEKKVKRYKELVKVKSISKEVYDDTKAALDALKSEIKLYKSQIKQAKVNLEYCYIKAPIDGIIGRSYVTEGAVVTQYQPNPLAVIQHFDPVYIDAPISVEELRQIRKERKNSTFKSTKKMDKEVGIFLEDGTKYKHYGVLEFNEVTVDETTSSVILRIKVSNPEKELLPGMFVKAKIVEGIKENGILIPQESLKFDPRGNPYVFLLDNENKVVTRPVKIDRAIGNKWLVISGLKEKDRLITKGFQYIRPGVSVVPQLEQ